MNPFQAIKASFYMLLAEAREPIQEPELAPASAGATRQSSTTPQSSNTQPTTARTGRRRTDSPFHHDSIIRRSWIAIVAWIAQPRTGRKQ